MSISALFELRITTLDLAGGRYGVSLFREQTSYEVSFVPDAQFKIFLQGMHDRTSLRLLNLDAQEKAATYIGELLFCTFFTGDILQQYRSYEQVSPCLRLALHLPQELFYIPWELLRDPQHPEGQFLARQGSITRFDAETKNSTILYHPAPEHTLLFLFANTEQLPLPPFDLNDGSHLRFMNLFPATYPLFDTHIRKGMYSGFVFFGHGDLDQQDQRFGRLHFVREERMGWVRRYLQDPKDGPAISDSIGVSGQTRLALLLACESAWASETVHFRNSVVGALLRRTRLAFVIGTQIQMNYDAARAFVQDLLDNIDAGEPLDLAVAGARRAVLSMDTNTIQAKYGHLDWWVPAVYATTANFDLLPNAEDILIPEAHGQPALEEKRAVPSLLKALGESFNKPFQGRLSSEADSASGLLP